MRKKSLAHSLKPGDLIKWKALTQTNTKLTHELLGMIVSIEVRNSETPEELYRYYYYNFHHKKFTTSIWYFSGTDQIRGKRLPKIIKRL